MAELYLVAGDNRRLSQYTPRRVKAVFTSPNYNNGTDYGETPWGEPVPDKQSLAVYLDNLERTFREVHRVAAPGCALWVNLKPSNPKFTHQQTQAIALAGWEFQFPFAWVYSLSIDIGLGTVESFGHFQPTPRSPNPHWGWEAVYLFRRQEDPPLQLLRTAEGVGVPYADKTNLTRFTAGNGGEPKEDVRCRGNVWFANYPTRRCRTHPCPFPAQLASYGLALSGVGPGDLVLDPYCGEGNAGEAAMIWQDADFLGVDLNARFLAEARDRLEKMQAFKATRMLEE